MAEGTLDSLERGLAAAEFVASRRHVSLAEVIDHLNVSKATAYRTLATLEKRGWVERDHEAGGYRPGLILMSFLGVSQAELVQSVAEGSLQQLVDSVGETANLALLEGNSLIYKKVVETTQSLRTHAEVGQIAELHMTALGRAFLSQIPLEEVDERLGGGPYRRVTNSTLTSRADVMRAIGQARQDGFAVEAGETEEGAACVAVALFDGSGRAIGAISVSGPIHRLRVTEMSSELNNASQEITRKLQGALASTSF